MEESAAFASDGYGLYRQSAKKLQRLYAGSNSQHQRYLAQRIEKCGKHRKGWRFCRVKLCPVCMWRRYKGWNARWYFELLPFLKEAHPEMRYFLLTLTVRNLKAKYLRLKVHTMAQAWERLYQLPDFPAVGWVRSLEVTRSSSGLAHPHYHVLLMIPPGRIRQCQRLNWAKLWQESLEEDYAPEVDIRKTTLTIGWYLAKPLDLYLSGEKEETRKWVFALTDQLHRVKLIVSGGLIKEYLQHLHLPRLRPTPTRPLNVVWNNGYTGGQDLGEELFRNENMTAEETHLSIDRISERLQKERGLSHEEALAVIHEAM